jgi:tetratricopeptide (TPR) repeat protein
MRRLYLIALVLCLLLPTAAAAERLLKGRLVLEGAHGELSAAEGVRVAVEATGDSEHTSADGLFRLPLRPRDTAGTTVKLLVSEPDWVIHHPLEGEVRVPEDLDETVEVRLLPKGSKRLWTDERIERFIQDIAAQAKEEVRLGGRPQEIDFGRLIRDWAARYGFGLDEVQAEIDRWATEVEANQDDFYKRGLVEYWKENFQDASRLFTQSAETKAQRLERVRERQRALAEKEAVLLEETVRDFRLAGNAAYANYAFDQALDAYRRALAQFHRSQTPEIWAATLLDVAKAHYQLGIRVEGAAAQEHLNEAVAAYRAALTVYTREFLPQDWAGTQNNLGNALAAQGLRSGGEDGRRLLAEAVAAYQAALTVRTRERLPQDWAMTQNNLGVALADQGLRSGGEDGRRLLAEAVAAYQAALTVYTRERLPQDWAMTQNNLGNALAEQGLRSGGEDGRRLLAEAVAAFRAALTVHTLEYLPAPWAQTQANLARAYTALQDWPGLANTSVALLAAFPDRVELYQLAQGLYHEVLFDFEAAHRLTGRWLERHPDDLDVQCNFAETHFTTGRFAEAEARLAALLVRDNLGPETSAALRLLQVFNLLALGKADAVPARLRALAALIEAQPEDFTIRWSFAGTAHFIGQASALAAYRDGLLGLIAAVKGANRATLLTVLGNVEASFQR